MQTVLRQTVQKGKYVEVIQRASMFRLRSQSDAKSAIHHHHNHHHHQAIDFETVSNYHNNIMLIIIH